MRLVHSPHLLAIASPTADLMQFPREALWLAQERDLTLTLAVRRVGRLWARVTGSDQAGDLGAHASRVTVVMMTEFGRRVRENANNGTDHGAGAVMLVQGAGVNGGKMYGDWPGLKDNQLDQGDLAVATDYRRVLSEILVKRQGQTAIEQVFPTVPYKPIGVVS